MAKETQQLPQLTFKKCGMDAKDAIRHDKQVYLGRVMGEAAAIKTKEARSGDTYQYLIGEFRIVRSDGEIFESSKLFLPGTIMEHIEAALGAENENAPVQFAWDIFSAPDEKSSVGYVYAAKSLLKPESSNRIEEISAKLENIKMPAAPPPLKKEK